MKKIKIFLPVVFFSVLFIISGCGYKADQINLSDDGYGRTSLDNGITVLVNHDETTSLTSARILVGGGVLTENAENNGITNLMIQMILKGNDVMSAAEITEKLDFLGASMSVSCYRDYSAISFTSLTENFNQVLEIISRSLLSPIFPEEKLTKLKLEVEGEIRSSDDSQSAASSKLFWKTAYGDNGYGLPTLGTMESISSITIDDIKNHYQKYVGGKNMIYSISTDLPLSHISSTTQQYLGEIKADAEILSAPLLKLKNEKNGFISYDRNQSFIYMGYILSHLESNEVPYVLLLNEIMGGTVGSRLWYLRQKEKLAYSVYTQYTTDKYGSIFRAAIGTDTSKVNIALASLDRELNLLVDEGITENELTDAKINMKNTLFFSIDRKRNRANNMAYYEYVGYNYRFILDLLEMANSITLDEVNNFVKEKFSEDLRYVSIAGKK